VLILQNDTFKDQQKHFKAKMDVTKL